MTAQPESRRAHATSEESALSYGQRALWFLDRLSPGNPAYLIAGAARTRGLDSAPLKRAALTLARRHPALRTTFHAGLDGPVQRVGAEPDVDFRREDATALDEAALAHHLSAVAYQPFDLENGPLWRLALLELAGGEQALVLSIHHIVSDFWSLAVLLRDLGALYGAEIGLAPARLPEPGTDFAQVVAAQQARLAGPEGERLLQFWRDALAGVPLVLDLPTDRPRPPVQTYRGGLRRFALAPGPAEALRRLARRQGATLYIGLLAAFDVLLHRYSGQERLLVGCPTTGRKTAELSGLVGYLVNPVAIAADFRGDPGFGELLSQVRAAALAAFAHQDYPLPLLAERLQQERSSGRSPIFQVMCVLQKGRRAAEKGLAALSVGEAGVRLDFGPLVLESLALTGPGAQFDLSLALAETERGLVGRLLYNQDLFEAATAARLLGHFEVLLTAITTGAFAERTSGLPLLSPAEAQQLLVEWNAPEAEYPGSGLVPERIAAVSVRSPAAVALVLEGHWMSYGELELRAARIGRHLRALGVGPESLVALLAERSFAMVAALLGIWKAGGAYLPLDGSLPAERLAFMLADARVAAVLVEDRLAPVLAELPAGGAHTMVLENLWDTEPPSVVESARSAALLLPEHPAYVLYTSGSTGKPKGVVIPHGALANRMHLDEVINFAPGDSFLHKTTISFDTSIEEIFGPLLVGGKTVLARPGGERDPGYLIGLLRQHEVSHASFNTAVLAALLKEHSLRDCGSLRTMLTGGEAVPPDLPQLFHVRSTAELLNRYGPTEATISVTSWLCPRETRDRVVPIGRPVARAEIHLLDRHFQPVPIGIPGELCIAGICLARGYLDRPVLTAEKFAPCPFPFTFGGRLYRSGDLARYRTDGAIEFLGRIDSQVKVRGFRVELGEIEAALKEHPALAGVAVVDREEPVIGSRRLVAYFEVRPGHNVTAADLRKLLQVKLPEYMIPAAFMALDRLPLGPTGKVDRRALPEPEASGGVQASAATAMGEAPRGPLEELLAGIWSDLLGVPEPGRQDDFFALGGHSLLAIQAMSRVREALGVELPLKVVFEAPTLAGFAAAIAAERPDRPQGPPPPPLRREPRDGPPPLSLAQERLWFLDQLQPGSPAYNLPGVFELRGDLDREAFSASLREIVRRHEALRTAFAVVSGKPAQIVSPERSSEAWAVPVVELAGLPGAARGAEVLRLTREEALRPFDLARGPLLRAALLHVEEGIHRALFTMHHMVSDGWSIGVLIREMEALYKAAVAGRPSPLPELPVQYADYAVWQRGWLSGEILARQLAWWRERLAGIPEVLDLPADRPRPAVASLRGGLVPLALPGSLMSDLSVLGRRRGMTPFMVLLAVLAALLSRLTGEERVIVGSPVANRTHREIEGLIGFFVTTLPLPADLSGDPRFSALLAQVREMALAAYVHQDVPFEKLVEELAPRRSLSWSPLFQVMLVLQNTPRAQLALPGLTVDFAGLDSRTEKFDLTFFLTPWGEEMTGVLSYSADLFLPATAERFAGWFEVLLAAAVAEPEGRASELSLLAPEERHQLIGEWNDTPRDFTALAFGGPLCLHRLVEAQARRSPRRVAVLQANAQGTGDLTYGELDRQAENLAEILRARGVGPEARVGISLERSPTMIVCLLAVLKAGGAFVPLDPDYPGERLRFMLAHSRPSLILCEPPQAAALGLCAEQWLAPRTARSEPQRCAATAPRPEAGADNAAYLIYTSGSTGRPKGVVVSHGAACNHMLWLQTTFELGSADRILQKSPLSFDASIWEIFGALIAGARLVLAGQDAHRDTAHLAAVIARHRVTATMMVPTLVAALLDEPGFATGGSLRVVLSAGEALTPALRNRFLSLSTARLVNAYGPTEAAIDIAWDECRRPPDSESRVAIGRPLANSVLHVLGRHLELLPIGAPGELYLGGVGLARGYWERPDLTAERFVPDPFGEGGRLYRSGDVARRWADGRIEFVGRIDYQVKLRGQRVELGEIEAALQRIPGVRQAAVVLREARRDGTVDGKGRAYLAAYVVTADDRAPSAAALRAALRNWLPDALIPATFSFLAHLPVTPTGKLDRAALPLQEQPAERPATPASDKERRLAALWTELLGVAEVGVDDGFFTLGGDSILGLQLVARARRQGLELSLRQIFENQTLAELARVAVDRRPPLAAPAPASGPVPLSPSQLGFLAQPRETPELFNQAVLLELTPGTEAAWLEAVLDRLVDSHEALRLRFWLPIPPSTEGTRAEIAAPGEPSPFAIVDLGALARERERQAIDEVCAMAHNGLDLQRGPLFRAVLLRRAPGGPDRLLLTVHHLVIDGVSWRILLEELVTGYRHLAAGGQIALPRPTASYRDHAVRLVERAAQLGPEVAAWLLGPAAPAAVPRDLPHPAAEGAVNTAGSAATCSVHLGIEATRALLRDANAAYQTRALDLLVTALVRALEHWTGAGLWWLALEGHGREDDRASESDLTRTVGWWSHDFPVLFDLRGAHDPGAALRRVRETLRRIPGGGLGFSLLRHLAPDYALRRQLAEQPSPEIVLNYLGSWSADLLQPPLAGAEILGTIEAPQARRSHLLAVNAVILGDRLRLDWTFSRNLHHRATIAALARSFEDSLSQLISHCLSRRPAASPAAVDLAVTLSAEQLQGALAAAGDHTGHNVEAIYPLSPSQEGMFFESFAAGRHIEQASWDLHGTIEPAAWREAFREVVAAHPALRSSFVWPEERSTPLQVVLREVPLRFAWHDLSHLDPARRRQALTRHERNARRSLRPAEAPLLLLDLFTLSPSEHRLAVTHHHLILDGWSFFLVLADLCAALRQPGALRERREPAAYGDYLRWLQRLDGAHLETYWRRRLAGFDRPTPLGRPAHVRESTEARRPAGRHRGSLPAALTARLTAQLRHHGHTLSTAIEALWALLLGCYSGHRDVLFGVTASGRQAAVEGIETIVGLLIYTLPVRVAIPPEGDWWSWLAELRRQRLDDGEHGPCGAGQLQQWSEVREGVPLYHSLLVVENYPLDRSRLDLPWIEAGEPLFRGAQTRHPLVLIVIPGRALELEIVYDPRRLARPAVRRIVEYLKRLVAAVLGEPRPSLATVMAAIPDQEIPDFFASTVETLPGAVPSLPPSDLERHLLALWREVLARPDLGLHDSFFDLGGHSLQALQLASRISRDLERDISIRTLLFHPTVARLAAALAASPPAAATAPIPAATPSEETVPPSLTIVRQSPLALHAVGRLKPLDAVALGCLPPALLSPGLERSQVIDHWCEGLPALITTRETGWGRIGILLLPRFSDDLYRDLAALLVEIGEALAMAGQLGASTVSLTGLIPSATEYGRAIQRQPHGPAITTGHATTCATVLLSIERILQEAGRELQRERIAFLGLGSIGTTTLRALLERWPHPTQITLCDVYRKLPDLEALAAEIRGKAGFTGEIVLAAAGAELPAEVYESSLLIGASNAPNILDIERLRPGTLVVDDSAPHCYDPAAALRRIREQGDVLVREGGFLCSPEPLRDTVFLPRRVEDDIGLARLRPLLVQRAHDITGCVLSGLLSHRFPELPPTVGPVDAETCLIHYDTLHRLGFRAADLCCEGLPPWSRDDLNRFCARFGASQIGDLSRNRTTPPPLRSIQATEERSCEQR